MHEGDWLAGKRNGYGTVYKPNGAVYAGNWKNDDYHGYGEYRTLESIGSLSNKIGVKISNFKIFKK